MAQATLWCYHNSIEKIMYFEYQHGRGQKDAIGMLQDFCGVLQTDGWDSYKSIADKIKTITVRDLQRSRLQIYDYSVYKFRDSTIRNLVTGTVLTEILFFQLFVHISTLPFCSK